ncbi:MAG: ATP-binding domain-containing protein [Actinomycetota bacterium]|nr:ATP-binding domain-containing protein [Actinomycetota bacterium]
MTDWTSDRLADPNDPDVEDRRTGIDVSHGGQTTEGDGPVRELDLDRPDEIAAEGATVRQLALGEQVWRFGHVIVDEAQDLTPMQWRMVVRRSRTGAVTMLGDLAQRSIGEPGSWAEHLPPQLKPHAQRDLTINYRSPAEINDLAAAVLRRLAPDLPVSRSVRHSGHEPEVVAVDDLDRDLAAVVADVAARQKERPGRAVPPAVIGFDLPDLDRPSGHGAGEEAAGADEPGVPWYRALSPWRAKGLEFDEVVVVEPARFLDEPNGLSLLYVALTRSTDRLTLVHQRPLPDLLHQDG